MNLTRDHLRMLCEQAKIAALEAGQYIQSQVDQHYEKRQKDGGDSLAAQVVTEVDLKAQEIIVKQLKSSIKEYDLGLLTEETIDDQSRLIKDYFWCIDPMDGTLPFTEGRTGYAVSIALISQKGNPVIGVVHVPDLKDCYTSVKGQGVYLNDELFQREKFSLKNFPLQLFMDQSFASADYYDEVIEQLQLWSENHQLPPMQIQMQYGAVRNALEVIKAPNACYFKFPKANQGGGSIWDYAATRLFFEELGLYVSTANGEELHLNRAETTFMNDHGVIYTGTKLTSELLVKVKTTVFEGK